MPTYITRHRAFLERQTASASAVAVTGVQVKVPDPESSTVPVPASMDEAPVVDPADRRPTGDIDQGSRGRGPIDPGRVRPSSADTRAALRALGLTPPLG